MNGKEREQLIRWIIIMTAYDRTYFEDLTTEDLEKLFIRFFKNYKKRTLLVIICTVCSEPITFPSEEEALLILEGYFKCPRCKQRTDLTKEYYQSIFKQRRGKNNGKTI